MAEKAKQSQNSAIKSRITAGGADKIRSALGQGLMGQLSKGAGGATSSNLSGGLSKKGTFAAPTKKNVPRFMTKKEKEAKEAQDKK